MTARSLIARCPAKLNLSLRVLGRRADGYHELDTVFQAIDMWDRVHGTLAPALELVCDHPDVPSGPDNLAWRAADLLRRRLGRPDLGASLRIDKAIPVQGGLGGGSSDAAGALLLCSRLWRADPSGAELRDIAVELGADVPFFLVGGTARGTGRGDRVDPLPFAGSTHFLLGTPPFGIPTAEVFAAVCGRLTLPGNGVNLRRASAHKSLRENDLSVSVNDLEQVVFDGWPELVRFRDALVGVGARRPLLSGSGSTVYGVFDNQESVERAMERLQADFREWRLFPACGVTAGAHVVEEVA